MMGLDMEGFRKELPKMLFSINPCLNAMLAAEIKAMTLMARNLDPATCEYFFRSNNQNTTSCYISFDVRLEMKQTKTKIRYYNTLKQSANLSSRRKIVAALV